MKNHDPKSTITKNQEELTYISASESFNSNYSKSSSFSDIDNIIVQPPDSPDSSSSDNLKLLSQHISEKLDSQDSHDHNISTNINNNDTLKNNTTSNEPDNVSSEITSTNNESNSSYINGIVGSVIKMISFQLNLLVSSVTLPIWLTFYSYKFMIDPFTSIKIVKRFITENLKSVIGLCFSCVRKHDTTWKLGVRVGWGLLWLVYVGFILVSLLVFALVVSGVILKSVMEEPVRVMEELTFDYTKDSPTAFVPLMSCPESDFLECGERVRDGLSGELRVIPIDHKVYASVLLTLPESYYNRNLGIFQVRVDFLSGNGQRLASTRQPCMLQFRSPPIRLMLTFFKLVPLVTGYSSESQTLNIKFRGYTERNDPTSCLRVILEQRAEFTKGGGIPEIYEAFLKLESQPPFLKRILWYWKGTVYIWISITIFVVELLFTLVCCTPIIAPWLQRRGDSPSYNAPRDNLAGQNYRIAEHFAQPCRSL
ncbi:adipose-regulatory protein, seipin [Tanacetum coccineum]